MKLGDFLAEYLHDFLDSLLTNTGFFFVFSLVAIKGQIPEIDYNL